MHEEQEEALRPDTPESSLQPPGALPQEANTRESTEGPTPISAWESDSQALTRMSVQDVADAAEPLVDQEDSGDATNDAEARFSIQVPASFDDVELGLDTSALPNASSHSTSPPQCGAQPLDTSVAEPPQTAQPPLTDAQKRRIVLPPLQNSPPRAPALRTSRASPVLPVVLTSAPAATYSVMPAESRALKATWQDEASERFGANDSKANACVDTVTKVIHDQQFQQIQRHEGVLVAAATGMLALGAAAVVAMLPWVVPPCGHDFNARADGSAVSRLLPIVVLLALALAVSAMEHVAFLIERPFGTWRCFLETFVTSGKFLAFLSYASQATALSEGDPYTDSLAMASRSCIVLHSVFCAMLGLFFGRLTRSLPNVFADDRPDRSRNILSAQLLFFGTIAGTLGVGLRGLRYSDRNLTASIFTSIFLPMRFLGVLLLDVPHLVLGCLLFINSFTERESGGCTEEQAFQAWPRGALGVAAMLGAIAGICLAFKTCCFDWKWIWYGSFYRQRFVFLAKKARFSVRWKNMQKQVRSQKHEMRLKKQAAAASNNTAGSPTTESATMECQQEAASA